MSKYQNNITVLLKKLNPPEKLEDLLDKLEESFQNPQIIKHPLRECFFCEAADIRIREESIFIATLLIGQKFNNLEEIFEKIQKSLFFMSSKHERDQFFHQHLLTCFTSLKHKPLLKKRILQFSNPIFNPWTEKIIRSSLFLSSKEKIIHNHVQILALSAWLHPLRQNVGSCFATAPAIIVQCEQPEQFFDDLESLLNIGILKRTFVGNEYIVPISTSWGPGVLNKKILITSQLSLWNSSELLFCLNRLGIIDKEGSIEDQRNHLKKLFPSKLKLKENQIISLKELITLLLRTHFEVSEKDISSKTVDSIDFANLQINRQELSQPLSKKQRFEEAFAKAQYDLVSYHEHPLLKTWEYTLASFAETQSQFYKWNLFTSLGFDSKQPYSIAQCIYKYLEEKIKSYEEQAKHHDREYEQEFYHVKMLEKRVVDTESERTANWARVEYQNHLNEFNFHRKMRDHFIDKSEAISKLLSHLLGIYDQLFPRYFQEVYDASMQEISHDLFADSPAGFRLLYKHGRQDPILWSFVRSKEDFITYLKEFFINTEFEISNDAAIKEFKQEYGEIVTQIVHLLRSKEFILAAYQRIAERYQMNPSVQEYTEVEKWPYQPWCYISGGTMEGLLSHYYKREAKFTKIEQRVASVTELMAFLIEAVRSLTPSQMKSFLLNPDKSLLMFSPGHAFLFKPGWVPLDEIWDKKDYSFTWIRDQIVYPQLKFIQSLKISPAEISFFLDQYLGDLPYFNLWLKENVSWPSYSISIHDFRNRITSCLDKAPSHALSQHVNIETIDSWIYQSFPIFRIGELESSYENLLESLFLRKEEYDQGREAMSLLMELYRNRPFIQSHELYELLKLVVSIVYQKSCFEKDWSQIIMTLLRKNGYMMPQPFVFADTNWPYYNFAFVVSPATEQLELWRLNTLGNKGFPMHQWRRWFSESQALSWGILTNSEQYLSHKTY